MHTTAVHSSPTHAFSKGTVPQIVLVEGHGVVGDAHAGVLVKHRSRVARDPSQPNLRQVHLLHEELLDELRARGLPVLPGQLGENVTTRGLDLLGLSAGTRLRLGAEAVVQVTGLRNPCAQIEAFMPGALEVVLARTADGRVIRKSGVMAVVVTGGLVRAGDRIAIECEPQEHVALAPV